jgi:hypothetical protein
MNDTTQTQVRGRGRPAGSSSFVRISLADLSNLIGPNGSVMVSKKWLDSIGACMEESTVAAIRPIDEPATEQPKIEFQITSFDSED